MPTDSKAGFYSLSRCSIYEYSHEWTYLCASTRQSSAVHLYMDYCLQKFTERNKDGMSSLELMRMAAYDFPLFEDMKRELQQRLNISVALVVMLRGDSSFAVAGGKRVPYLRR